MADEGTQETLNIQGQSEMGPQGTETTYEETGNVEGQSSAAQTQETTQQGTQQAAEETFFDPRDLEGKPELQAAYKQMQGAFSKKMEDVKANRQKIEAYDAFAADPISQLQTMARQYGYSLTRAEAAQQLEQQQGISQDWEPKSWNEVIQKAEERAYERLKSEQGPLYDEVKNLRKSNLETYLDNNAPDWRTYEDDMMETLKTHPTLVNNPMALYKLAVPDNVLQSRATQQALKKMQEKGKSAATSGASTTTKKSGSKMPEKPVTFDEAVKIAEAQLAEQGIRKPGL